MVEVHDEDGKLIATIHDPEAFSKLLDNFERQKRHYDRHFIIKKLPINYIIGPNIISNVIEAARQLQAIRKQLGDDRTDLYPVEGLDTDNKT